MSNYLFSNSLIKITIPSDGVVQISIINHDLLDCNQLTMCYSSYNILPLFYGCRWLLFLVDRTYLPLEDGIMFRTMCKSTIDPNISKP